MAPAAFTLLLLISPNRAFSIELLSMGLEVYCLISSESSMLSSWFIVVLFLLLVAAVVEGLLVLLLLMFVMVLSSLAMSSGITELSLSFSNKFGIFGSG